MIRTIASGAFVEVTGGKSTMPYITPNTDIPMHGMVRIHGNDLQVWSGGNWVQIAASYPIVGLSSSAQSAISWAMVKMAEEAELEKLSHSHPAVRAAYENMRRAAEQLKTTIILSKDEQTTT